MTVNLLMMLIKIGRNKTSLCEKTFKEKQIEKNFEMKPIKGDIISYINTKKKRIFAKFIARNGQYVILHDDRKDLILEKQLNRSNRLKRILNECAT